MKRNREETSKIKSNKKKMLVCRQIGREYYNFRFLEICLSTLFDNEAISHEILAF